MKSYDDIIIHLEQLGLNNRSDAVLVKDIEDEYLESIVKSTSIFNTWFIEECEKEFERRTEEAIFGNN